MSSLKIRLLFLFSVIILSSCTSIMTLSNGKQIDKKLVGIWQGSETDQQIEGMKKEWKMTRTEEGTFVLEFKTIYNGKKDEFIEKGNWWIDGNKFFEYHDNSNKTDTYKYLVLNENQVQFEMINTEIEFENNNYTFIDTRILDNKLNKNVKDGLSIENAIKVKSVDEEYNFIRKNCINCKLLEQYLTKINGKPYDVLKIKKEDGQEVLYYFDISSFYGKW